MCIRDSSYNDQYIYNLISEKKSILSTSLKHITDHQKGLDTILDVYKRQVFGRKGYKIS